MHILCMYTHLFPINLGPLEGQCFIDYRFMSLPLCCAFESWKELPLQGVHSQLGDLNPFDLLSGESAMCCFPSSSFSHDVEKSVWLIQGSRSSFLEPVHVSYSSLWKLCETLHGASKVFPCHMGLPKALEGQHDVGCLLRPPQETFWGAFKAFQSYPSLP